MKFNVVKYILSLFLIISISVMEYSIVTDDTSDVTSSKTDVIKKTQESHDLFHARNFNNDDDEDAGVIKYFAHQFYNCDVFLSIHFIQSSTNVYQPSLISAASFLHKQYTYQKVNSYRI